MSAQAAPSAPITVAVIGCGKMGINHIKAILACPEARLVAISDPVADLSVLPVQLPEGVGRYQSAAEMLEAARPEVVHIVTPPGTHAELAHLCLASGAHIYIEKPFTPTAAEARAVIEAARRAGRQVCAGHQLLFEPSSRAMAAALPLIGRVVHVESYFAFRTVRKGTDGRSPMSPIDQLMDILPHPVYTLVNALGGGEQAPVEVVSAEVAATGEVRAILRSDGRTATLVVTLNGRPIESYLRLVGTNGSLRADFVRGYLGRLPGPGTNAIALVINAYRDAAQNLIGSTRGFASRILGRRKGYPGVTELAEAFYESIRGGRPSPLPSDGILETVRICEVIGERLRRAEAEQERQAQARLAEAERLLPPSDAAKGVALVTGGAGLLGRAVVQELRRFGWAVRATTRRMPAASQREPGIEYVVADLSQPLDPGLFAGVSTVVHCAAETAGGKQAHDRNTVAATRNLLDAAAANGVRKFLHVSSIAVLKPGREVGSPLSEQSPLDAGNLGRGPYVWAKAEAERDVVQRAPELGLTVRIVRPGPLVDFDAYTPPGRLGREIGPLFVAIGPRANRLSLCAVRTGAEVIRAAAEDFESMPPVLNLVEPVAPTRAELLDRWLQGRPDLAAMWVPGWVLAVLSPIAVLAQRILRPGTTPIDVAAAFSSEQYDTSLAAQVIARARTAPRGETVHA